MLAKPVIKVAKCPRCDCRRAVKPGKPWKHYCKAIRRLIVLWD
jgi:hypothetical protein